MCLFTFSFFQLTIGARKSVEVKTKYASTSFYFSFMKYISFSLLLLVKYKSDTYKIISQENKKSGREVGLACKNKWNWSWLKEKMLMEIFYQITLER